nr:MAG TPA: hypothetical protein [Crassvirales sp.]
MVLMVKQCYEIIVKDAEEFSSIEQLIIIIDILMTVIINSGIIHLTQITHKKFVFVLEMIAFYIEPYCCNQQ